MSETEYYSTSEFFRAFVFVFVIFSNLHNLQFAILFTEGFCSIFSVHMQKMLLPCGLPPEREEDWEKALDVSDSSNVFAHSVEEEKNMKKRENVVYCLFFILLDIILNLYKIIYIFLPSKNILAKYNIFNKILLYRSCKHKKKLLYNYLDVCKKYKKFYLYKEK